MKAGDITISGGTFAISSRDDAMHAKGSITIDGGEFELTSNDDGIHADDTFTLNGGTILITECYEGIEAAHILLRSGTIVASGGYGRNTQTFSRAENQACLLLKWQDEQPAGEAVTLKSEENVILTATPGAPFKTLIVSTPALKEGQSIAVWQGDAAVCQRTISGSLMQFPVTPSRKAKASRRIESGAAATEPPAKSAASGSMTAHPASPASSEPGYWLYTPVGAKQEQLPLIVYLHGGSGKGSDLQRITSADGFPQYLQTGKLGDVRAYVICPQCPESARGWQEAAEQVFALIDSVCARYPIDANRIILTGHSMGGTGTWALAALAPQRFSCIVPMSGSVALTRRNQQALSKLPIWAFVASDDRVVDPSSSADCVSRLNAAGAQARLTVFEGAGHRDVPALAWLDEELGLLSWMLAQ